MVRNRLNPKQYLCWESYVDPESPTFANAYQSALKAGYSTDAAKTITGCEWFDGLRRRASMRMKGEKVLDQMLDMPVEIAVIEGHGEEARQVVKTDPALIRIKQDTAKFAVERLGKDDWSTRNEHTGADGRELPTPILATITEKPNAVPSDDGGQKDPAAQ